MTRPMFHCDDIGMTPAITERILEAWRAGLLDGFSVIRNGTGLDAVSRGLHGESDRPVLLTAHLNLSEGPPSAPAAEVPLLLDETGQLSIGWGQLARGFILGGATARAALKRQIEVEWRAQIGAVAVACAPRKLDGVDGHLHVHMFPAAFPIAASLAREFGIPRIRISREPFHLSRRAMDTLSPAFASNLAKHLLLRFCSIAAVREAKRMGLQCFDSLVGVLYTGRMTRAAAEAGIAAAERKGAKSIEVLFHIGRATPAEAKRWSNRPSQAAFPLSRSRDREYAELKSMRASSRWT